MSDAVEPWHARPLDALIASLDSTPDGLSGATAATRLTSVGPNVIPRTPPKRAWAIFVDQLRSVVVLLLVAAIVGALITADAADAIAVGAVLVLNVALGFVVEIRARRAVEALGQLEARHATVVRDGHQQEIDASTLVPGDVVVLEAGQAVPADARLLSGSELRVIEASLTGESVPVSKYPQAAITDDTPLPDRTNMLYAGTTVAAGSARAMVVATGGATELGAIGRLVDSTATQPTPLERRLNALGRQLVWIAVAIGALTAFFAWRQGAPAATILEAGIALAVAAVPEGLPAVATITLALGVHRMARQRALVRTLPSVETLGSVTVICTDKTGTLTAGAMTVTTIRTEDHAFTVTGAGYEPTGTFSTADHLVRPEDHADLRLALTIATAANRGDAVLIDGRWVSRGDPTDAAIIVAARKAGIDRAAIVRDAPEIGEVPFSSDRKLIATFHRGSHGERLIAYVKGAPAQVLARCGQREVDGRQMALDEESRARLIETNHQMAAEGLRVLAVAHGAVDRPEEAALGNLTFVGLIGMNDPAAPGVKEAVQAFQRAGIATVMITGDQRGTAEAVARDLGLTDTPGSLDGAVLDRLSDEELRTRTDSVQVFSRVSPRDKLRIVQAYQQRGEIVAMIGDGVNDAAAMKKADVGVTMGGRGTDVARETADLVLEDDRFETIGVAIEQGRIVFDNIQKFVFYLFSCNLAEIFVLLGTSAVGLPLPLQPIQVLWLNLVTDTGPALALALEPGEPDTMRRPPRDPKVALLSGSFLRSVGAYAVLIAASTFMVMAWSAINDVPSARATTMNFMTLAFAQIFHLGNARDSAPVIRPSRMLANRAALIAVAVGVLLQIVAMTVPQVATLLRVQPLTGVEWAIVLTASLVPAVLGQGYKAVKKRKTIRPREPEPVPWRGR